MICKTFQNEKLSGLGLGMMRLPVVGGEDSMVDEAAAEQIVDLAYKSGINYFDTAYVYGQSELDVRETIVKRYPRDSFYLATKLPAWSMLRK